MNKPRVSVLMPVYNGGEYLAQAVDSILAQSLADFEFVIINDGSTDKSLDVLTAYAARDQRIRLYSQKNQGIVAALNRGLKVARGELIARQDADDASEPERLEKQLAYLQAHPKTVIVGSSIKVMNGRGQVMHRHAGLLGEPEVRHELLIRSPFAHGSVVFKRTAAIRAGLYRQAAWPAEDYDLWLRLSSYGNFANLDEYLYIYREHSSSISTTYRGQQAEKLALIHDEAWQQRQRLLAVMSIEFRKYKKLDFGQQRMQRILDNLFFIYKQARGRDNALAARILLLLAGKSTLYKKTAGKIKRKIKS